MKAIGRIPWGPAIRHTWKLGYGFRSQGAGPRTPAPSELGLVVSVMLRRSALELRGIEEGGEKPVAFAIAQ